MALKELLKGVNYKIERFEETKEGIQFNILKPEMHIRPYKARWGYYRVKDLKTNKLILHIGENKVDDEREFFVPNFGHELVDDSFFSEILNEIAYLYFKQEKNQVATYFYAKRKNKGKPYLYSKHERNKRATYKLISDAMAINRQLFAQSKARA